MNLKRFYCDNIDSETAVLDSVESHHLCHVLRLKQGQEVELFDGRATTARAVIESTGKKGVYLSIVSRQSVEFRTTQRIIVAAAIAKGQRFDMMISKCTELGADHIIPVIFKRTVKLATGRNLLARLKHITVSAAKQSGQNILPVLSEPVDLQTALLQVTQQYPEAHFYYGDFSDEAATIHTIESHQDMTVFVGPEGGIADEERALFRDFNVTEICLTDTVLRTETAAISFCAICSALRSANKHGS